MEGRKKRIDDVEGKRDRGKKGRKGEEEDMDRYDVEIKG